MVCFCASIVLMGCGRNRMQSPKPKAYFRLDFPDKEYKSIENNYPFTFEVIESCNIQRTDPSKPNWLNILYPQNNATVYLTYKELNDDLFKNTEYTHNLVNKHNIKADAIKESYYNNDSTRSYGKLYRIEGNVACNMQFYLTDSVKHFIHGSLYFNNRPNKDSLAPVINYIQEDIIHLMETTRWK